MDLNEQNEIETNVTENEYKTDSQDTLEEVYEGTSDLTEAEERSKDNESEKRFAGKFKSVEDLEKGYKELVKKHVNREPIDIPETYELDDALAAAGLEIREEDAEDVEKLYAGMREKGFSQEQAVFAAQMIGSVVNRALSEAVGVNQDEQKAMLQEEWGDNTDAYIRANQDWARANLPVDVLRYPLMETAAGHRYVEQLRRQSKGAVPITTSNSASFNRDDLEAEKQELLKKYFQNDKEGELARSRLAQINTMLRKPK